MKLFLDCSDVELIKHAHQTGLIDGVTTNPSLMLKCGKDPMGVLRQLSELLPFHSSISAEVVAETTEEMLSQAADYLEIFGLCSLASGTPSFGTGTQSTFFGAYKLIT